MITRLGPAAVPMRPYGAFTRESKRGFAPTFTATVSPARQWRRTWRPTFATRARG